MTTTEKTKKILEKVIEKPKITVNLLERPPFKFIVDIVTSVIESTGFLKTDFSKDALQNAGKDKESKIAFLEQLIKILDTDGSLKNVKASKIVSGVDAEETNKMLQKLGTDAKKFRSENGDKKKEKKSKKEEKVEENPEEKKKKKKEKDKEEKSTKRSRSETKENGEEKKKKLSSKDRHKSSDKKEKKSKKLEKQDSKSEKILTRQDSMEVHNGEEPDPESPKREDNDDEGFGDEPEGVQTFDLPPRIEEGKGEGMLIKPSDMPPLIRPMTGAGGGRPMTSMGRPGTASSRPAPPKLKKKQIATVDSTPQVMVELKSEILSDSIPKLNLENDDAFIMENKEEDGDRTVRLSDFVEEEDRGALVQKIMETKAGIEESANSEDVEDSEDIRGITVEREKVKQLQEKLQDLTRSAYPLARMFDFANDDIESMVKEMERWRMEQRKNEQEEQNRRAAGFGDSSRLYTIIDNLHKEIREMKEELGRAKGRVLNNEKKIQYMISNF